jgi:hypothetical protein
MLEKNAKDRREFAAEREHEEAINAKRQDPGPKFLNPNTESTYE